MACREYLETLSSYVDDELKPLERLRVESHLKACSACRRYQHQIQRASAMLKGLDRLDTPRFVLRGSAGSSTSRAERWERIRALSLSRPQPSLKPALLAAVVFLVAITAFQGLRRVAPPGAENLPSEESSPGPETRPPAELASDGEISDSLKREIARRVLEANRNEARRLAEAQGTEFPPSGNAAAPAPGLEGSTTARPILTALEPEDGGDGSSGPLGQSWSQTPAGSNGPVPGRMAERSPEAPTEDRGVPAGLDSAPQKSATSLETEPPPAETGPRVVLIPTAAAGPAAPQEPSGTGPAAGTEGAGRAMPRDTVAEMAEETLELEVTYREVMVLAQADEQVTATFRPAEIDPVQSEEGTPVQESAEIASPEADLEVMPDPETGVLPPVPVHRSAPDLGSRSGEAHDRALLAPVGLRVTVDTRGMVTGVSLLPGSGSGLAWLDDAVASAVERWEFRPAERDGEPIAAAVEIVIEFDRD
jgi:TonB family protein